MKKFLGLLALLMFTVSIFAVQTIKGKIVDANTQSPLDFVNVALFKQNSTDPAAGVVTDDKGNFVLPNVPDGRYTLKVSFVGYNSIDIPLNVSTKELNVGTIKLYENSKALREVEVLGQGSQMRLEIDKKVFTVDQNIAAAGASASEVLENIPSVTVDGEGNVSLRNNASVEVWINGKPSGLTVENRAQILQQMPAESIQEIEIITNPSARFNPEGTAGIINIVLKKNRRGGYYGSVSAGLMQSKGRVPGYNTGVNINYSSGKLDAYANVGFRSMNFEGGAETLRYGLNANNDTVSLLKSNSTFPRGFYGLFGRVGLDYRLTDKNTLGFSGFGMAGSGYSGSNINYVAHNIANNTTRNYSRENVGSGTRPSINASIDHKYEIDKKGSNLMTSLSYSTHERTSDERIKQTENNTVKQDITQSFKGGNREIQLKIDYAQYLANGAKIETGWQSTDQLRSSPTITYDEMQTPRTIITALYNKFDYTEQIHAAYGTYGQKFGKLSLQGGLRAEYFTREWTNEFYVGNNITTSKSNYEPRFELFPSAFVSYTLPNKNELQLNYSRRINRPRGRSINPTRDVSDSTSISFGNPDLLPEITSAFELNYLKTWDNHSLSGSVYHRFTDDVIQDVRFMNNGILENTSMNVTKSNNTGLELVAKNRVLKVVNLTSSLNLYYNQLEAAKYISIYDSNVITDIPAQEMFSWNARVMANVILGRNTTAQISGDYSAPRLIAQGKQSSSYAIDLGLRQTFFDRNLSLNFMVRDLLDSRRRSTITSGTGFYQTSDTYFNGRMLGLTATYNFGNMKPKRNNRNNDQNMNMDMNMD